MLPTNLRKTHDILVAEPILPKSSLIIIVPVQNEAAHILQTLESFATQIDLSGRRWNFNQSEMIFFVNNSTDESAQIIRCFFRQNQFVKAHIVERDLPIEYSNIGYVRRALMNEAYLRLKTNGFSSGIIVTTDGDTIVAPDWIATNVAEIKNGADAVGGRILIKPWELRKMDAKCRSFHLRDTGYRLMAAEIEAYSDYLQHDALPRHHQHFNGSFAVTIDAFEKAGGVPEVRFLEDVAFYHSLLRVDAKFRHSPRVRVQTSARVDGRTELGLSTQISEWTMMGQNCDDYLVESAKSIKRRLRARKKIRIIWKMTKAGNQAAFSEIRRLADELFICNKFLIEELQMPQTFGNLYEKILHEQHRVSEWVKENPLVSVEKALFDLRLMLENLRR